MIPNGVLRSVIDFGGVSQTELVANMQKLISAKLDWEVPADQKLFNYACQFYRERQEVPAKQTLVDYFESTRDLDSLERVKDLEPAQYYIRSNFDHLIDSSVKEQKKLRALALLKEAQEIIAKGLVFSDTKVKKIGLKDGVLHFLENVSDLLSEASNARIEGDITKDGEEVWSEYLNAKANKALAWGKFTGLNNIDKVIKGIKKGELWIHAAFTGELKTTFAQNWCYNLITQYRTNVFYTSLEMPYEQIRQQFYAMHSSNARFKTYGLGPLDYEKIKSGQLTDVEEKFYQLVIRDFNNNPEYGSLYVWSPEDNVTTDDIKLKVEMHSESGEVGMLVIDHGGLVEPRKSERGKDYTIRLNSVIRDSKKLALHYKHGTKVPVLLLFQINREGKAEADKAEGNRYKLRALSYANEAERSADVVTTTYLNDDHRREGTTQFDCLKRRDGPFFEPFTATIDWLTKRISNRDSIISPEKGVTMDDMRHVSQSLEDLMFI
jgi:replicative DNA helicase